MRNDSVICGHDMNIVFGQLFPNIQHCLRNCCWDRKSVTIQDQLKFACHVDMKKHLAKFQEHGDIFISNQIPKVAPCISSPCRPSPELKTAFSAWPKGDYSLAAC